MYASEAWIWNESPPGLLINYMKSLWCQLCRSACGVNGMDGEKNECACGKSGIQYYQKGEGTNCEVVDADKA